MAQTVIQGDGFFTYFAQQAVSDRNILWIGLGRPTAWDGGVKPIPDNDVGLVDPILYQKADTAVMVRAVTIDDDYDYTWYSSSQTYYFKRITSDEAIAGNDRWIYISTTFLPGVLSLPEFTYRAVGYFHNLTPATGHENDTSLLPANVTNVGNILLLSHEDNAVTVGGTHTPKVNIAIQVGG
jgi:hypothetical protein